MQILRLYKVYFIVAYFLAVAGGYSIAFQQIHIVFDK